MTIASIGFDDGSGCGRPTSRSRKCINVRLAALNISGLNDEVKIAEVAEMFKKGSLDILALSETNLKGVDDVEWEGVYGIKSGVRGGRAKEGVAVLMTDKWRRHLTAYECVNSRLVMVIFKIGGLKLAVVAAYAPCDNREDAVKDEFWGMLDTLLGTLGDTYKVFVLGDMNGKVGNRVVNDVIGCQGVPGENDNGNRMKELCQENGLCIANTYFRHKDIH